ncbi:site-specific integrase [Massilia putida]|uniref:site-specific integrase n=1 Tax=Massilia putida TaxID=1141883 RepID=UPI000952EF61|nr:site-specific integrase [Massilia putida]
MKTPESKTSTPLSLNSPQGALRARGGSLFDPDEDLWVLRELAHEATLRFDKSNPLANDFKRSFKLTLAWYAQNRSLRHTENMFDGSQRLFKHKAESTGYPIVEITSVDILNFRAHLGAEREWYLSSLAGFLKKWRTLGYPGISPDAYTLLGQMRLKGNRKGVATATMDPVKGPLSVMETEALQLALNSAYGRGEVGLAEYTLCWLFMALGMRPTQYASLKVSDVVLLHKGNGAMTYSIRMPRAKTRQASARAQFKDRVLAPQIGEVVVKYAAQVKSRFVGVIDDPSQAPLFPRELVGSGFHADDYHSAAPDISNTLERTFNRLKVVSERTGKRIKINANRFRTAIGTRAGEEGHGELVIAELLDHTDTQNVGVYVGATPAIIDRIDRAVAFKMGPIAQAFAGKLIRDGSEASRGADPSSKIRAPAITGNFEPMSSCGAHGFCGFLKPIACYTCNSFEPWLDGPHEQVLDYLIADRERLMNTTGDSRVASVNDRAILAVAQVIQLCNATRSEGDATHG